MDTGNWLQTGAMVGMFLLRLGVPLLITVAVAYSLHRLDVKWQLAALERNMRVAAGPPCWELRNCPEEKRARCVAFQRSTVPCWAARRAADGRLPQPCLTCALFGKQRPAPQPV